MGRSRRQAPARSGRDAFPVLNRILVVPITRSIRRIPTEIPLDQEHGVDVACAASFDNLQPIRMTFLSDRIGSLPFPRHGICRTLAAMADC